ncbi:MAG: tRNA (guanine(10)-N(2))-dimethyltransferase [Thermoplasmata archaeon]|nr:MAG: tRNA (guanine(10)-N(2))-dimethyltransferase [Thermoplasmata archaeon]
MIPKHSQQEIKGPYRARGTSVFYNPQMVFTRDLTIAVVEHFIEEQKKPAQKMKFLDGLAGTGVRGIRLAKELKTKSEFDVVINEGNPEAIDLIKTNIKLNSLEDHITVENQNLNTLLTSTKFQFIDIDPFGSAVSFFDNAVRCVRPGGLLALTSTDTAPLCGTYVRTCKRRYDATPAKNEYMHESGLRILMGAFARTAAKYDIAIEPILLYSMDYYFRLFLKVTKGARRAEEMLSGVGHIVHNRSNNHRYSAPEPESNDNVYSIGPLWLGPLNDSDFVSSLNVSRNHFGSRTQLKKMCSIWPEESEMPPWHFDINNVASKLKIQPRKFKAIQQILVANGFSMVPTHFSPQGFKTDATMEDLRKLLK